MGQACGAAVALARKARAAAAELLPVGAGARLSRVYDQAMAVGFLHAHPTGREAAARLRKLRDSHAGQTCAIMGNGPSLRETEVALLRGIPTFGLNRIYLAFEWLGFLPTYLVCVNPLVLTQCATDLAALPMTRFLGAMARRHMPVDGSVILLASTPGPAFSTDPPHQGLWEGATVTYVALQLAYYLGFARVVLVGVDHKFATAGLAHQEVVSTGADPNHFDPNYFGKGFRWQLPDLETSEVAYRLARDAYWKDGREILDATVDGQLAVFPKVDLRDALPPTGSGA